MTLLRYSLRSHAIGIAAGILLAAVASAGVGWAAGPKPSRSRTQARKASHAKFDNPREASDWAHAQRAFPSSEIPVGLYARANRAWKALEDRAIWPFSSSDDTSPLGPTIGPAWKLIGPGPVDNGSIGLGSGRATAIAVDPTNASTVYAGFADGGVWKTTDGGTTWKPLTDMQPTLAVGAIVLDPRAPSTVYVGTGEGNFSADSFYGRGILKSTDGGTTWAQLAAETFDSLSIPRMFIDPAGAIYVGAVQASTGSGLGCHGAPAPPTRRGLYKSTNGGTSFTQIVAGKNVSDFEIDTTAMPPRGIIAVYKEGAFRFQETQGMATVTPIAGLPTTANMVTRTEFGRSKSNPMVYYAGVGFETTPARGTVYVSKNGGDTWSEISNAPNYCEEQCFYNNVVEVDPANADVVYLGGMGCAVTRLTGGTTSAPASSCIGNSVHADTHAIVFDPTNAARIWLGGDGGMALSANGGTSWTKPNTALSTLQFYNLCVDPNDATLIVGALQDNGIVQPQTPGAMTWRNIHGGDGMACANNLGDTTTANRYLVTSAQFGALARKTPTGAYGDVFSPGQDRVGFVAPLANDVNAPLNVYVGTYRVHKSTTGGTSGSFRAVSNDLTGGQMITCANGRMRDDVLGAIAAASQRVYTGSFSGKVFTSPDGGTTWTDVTKAPLPARYVSAFAINPTNPSDVLVAFSGFSSVTPTAPGHIFRSTNAGGTWTRFDTALDVDLPVNGLARNPASPNMVYAGTDLGVVGTIDGGTTWNPIGTGLPHVAVFSLQYHAKTSTLYASTHGRSAWSITFGPSLVPAPSSLTFYARPGQMPPGQTLTVSNGDTAGSTLQFTAAPMGGAWLSVTPTSGSATGGAAGQALTVSANTTGLGLGDYMGTIALSAPNATPMSVAVPVVLRITDTGVPPPDAGTGAGGSSGTDASVDGGGTGSGAGGATSGGGSGGQAGATSGGGGATGSGGATGTGGATATGAGPGSTSSGSGTGQAPPPTTDSDSGCGCRVGRAETTRSLFMAALVAFASVTSTVRRMARRRRENPPPSTL